MQAHCRNGTAFAVTLAADPKASWRRISEAHTTVNMPQPYLMSSHFRPYCILISLGRHSKSTLLRGSRGMPRDHRPRRGALQTRRKLARRISPSRLKGPTERRPGDSSVNLHLPPTSLHNLNFTEQHVRPRHSCSLDRRVRKPHRGTRSGSADLYPLRQQQLLRRPRPQGQDPVSRL